MIQLCRTLYLCSLALLLAGCLAATKETVAEDKGRPKWLQGQHSGYPQELYLTGTGESYALERAKDKARADLAKTFKVQIDSTAFQRTQSSSRTTSRGSSEVVDRLARQDITASTQAELESVEIVASWFDEKARIYHAFAALDRSKAAADFRSQIGRMDQETNGYLSRAKESSDALTEIGWLQRALNTQLQREQTLAYLNVVDPGSRARMVSGSPVDSLMAQLQATKQELRIGVAARGSAPQTVSEYARGGLANLGYAPRSDAQGDYRLEVELTVREPIQRDGLYWLVGDLELQLVESATQKTRGGCHWSIKKAARDLPLAEQKVFRQLQQMFDNDLAPTLDKFIAGQPCD